jgi:adenosylcobinamide kinase/adenosylcobinamide-phosphate guanylyltransferase
MAEPRGERPLPRLTLVLGGARSGKSRHAEGLVLGASPSPVYIATAEAWDEEMRARVAEHRRRRTDRGWTTVEEPLDLAGALAAHATDGAVVLVDCLTLWLTNQMVAERDVPAACDALLATLREVPGRVVLVSNEVGLGIVPENRMAREFRDHAGRLHQAIAAEADRVVLVVAGLPMVVKG